MARQIQMFTAGIGIIPFGVLVLLLFAPALPMATTRFLALVADGGPSNPVGRTAHGGCVVDFLNIGLGSLQTGVLNFVDSAIMAGVLGFMVKGLRQERPAGS